MIKEKINNLLKVLRKSIEKFPGTIISIYVLTIIFTCYIGNSQFDWNIIKRLIVATIIFASTSYLIETLVKEKRKNIVIYYIPSIIWSIILTILVYTKSNILGIPNDAFVHFMTRFIVCYIISISIISVYFNFKKSEKSFEEYFTKVVIGFFKTTIIYEILAIGSAIISSIFIFLILNGRGYILIGRVEILLLGLYYLPTLIYTLYSPSDEVGKFAKVIKYVLGSLLMTAFAIIYIYILKIIILRDIPSNQIFRILAALFIVGLPIWTMCDYLNEGKTFDKINDKLPLLFIPFIFLQMYSIGVRIGANGITEARYLCVMLIIFEIIYTIIYIKDKLNIGKILLVAVALTIISTIAPFINMYRISAMSQYNILQKYAGREDITSEEKSKLNGAYGYLEGSVIGKQYLNNNLNQDIEDYESNMIANYLINPLTIENPINLDASRKSNFLNVEGYKTVKKLDAGSYVYIDLKTGDTLRKDSRQKLEDIFSDVRFKIEDTEEIINVNMLDLVKKYLKSGNTLDEEFENMNEIILDDNRKIILDYFSISYYEKSDKVDYYSIDAYLLEK